MNSRANQYVTRRTKNIGRALPVVIGLSWCFNLGSSAQSHFQEVNIPGGVNVKIPSNWGLLTQNDLKTGAASAEAVTGQVIESRNLLGARTMKGGAFGYASVRISHTLGECPSQNDVRDADVDSMKVIEDFDRKQTSMAADQSGREVTYVSSTKEKMAKRYFAFCWKYKRASFVDNGGDVMVAQYVIPFKTHHLRLTVSYEMSREVVWSPIISKIVDSFELTNEQQWPPPI